MKKKKKHFTILSELLPFSYTVNTFNPFFYSCSNAGLINTPHYTKTNANLDKENGRMTLLQSLQCNKPFSRFSLEQPPTWAPRFESHVLFHAYATMHSSIKCVRGIYEKWMKKSMRTIFTVFRTHVTIQSAGSPKNQLCIYKKYPIMNNYMFFKHRLSGGLALEFTGLHVWKWDKQDGSSGLCRFSIQNGLFLSVCSCYYNKFCQDQC